MKRQTKLILIAAALALLSLVGFGCYRAVVGISRLTGDLQESTGRLQKSFAEASAAARTIGGAIQARDGGRLMSLASSDLAARTTAEKLVADLDRSGLPAALAFTWRPAELDVTSAPASPPPRDVSITRLDAFFKLVHVQGDAEMRDGTRVPVVLLLKREDERWRLVDIRASLIGMAGR